MTGTVEKMPQREGKSRDFTFVKGNNGDIYFLHISSFKSDWRKLVKGPFPITVKFDAVEGKEGPNGEKRMRAENCFFSD